MDFFESMCFLTPLIYHKVVGGLCSCFFKLLPLIDKDQFLSRQTAQATVHFKHRVFFILFYFLNLATPVPDMASAVEHPRSQVHSLIRTEEKNKCSSAQNIQASLALLLQCCICFFCFFFNSPRLLQNGLVTIRLNPETASVHTPVPCFQGTVFLSCAHTGRMETVTALHKQKNSPILHMP